MALKTPLIKSVTKRGKDTAFKMACVVPATFCADTPLKSLPAFCAKLKARLLLLADGTGPEEAVAGALSVTTASSRARERFSCSSRRKDAPASQMWTMDAASWRRWPGSSLWYEGEAVRISRTRTRTSGSVSGRERCLFAGGGARLETAVATLSASDRRITAQMMKRHRRVEPRGRCRKNGILGNQRGFGGALDIWRNFRNPGQQECSRATSIQMVCDIRFFAEIEPAECRYRSPDGVLPHDCLHRTCLKNGESFAN